MRQQRGSTHAQSPRQRVAAHAEHAHARQRRRCRRRRRERAAADALARIARVQQHAKRRRHQQEPRHTPLAQYGNQRVGARGGVRRQQQQRHALCERPHHLPERVDEAERCLCDAHLVGRKRVRLPHPLAPGGEALPSSEHALGQTSGARAVQHVAAAVGQSFGRSRGLVRMFLGRSSRLEQQRRPTKACCQSDGRLAQQQRRGRRVLHHPQDALTWIAQIQRQIHRTDVPHREHASDLLGAAFREHPNHLPPEHLRSEQSLCQQRDVFCEPSEAQRAWRSIRVSGIN